LSVTPNFKRPGIRANQGFLEAVGFDLRNDILDGAETMVTGFIQVKTIGHRKDGPTGCAMILLEKGDNRIVINPGANGLLNEKDGGFIMDNAKEGDFLIAQLEAPLPAVEAVLASGHQQGLYTILNPTPVKELPDSLYPCLDLLVVNEVECAFYSGITPEKEKDLQKAYQVLAKKGLKRLLVTLGKRGSIYLDGDTLLRADPYPVQAIDTTGAGDTYIGYLSALLLEKKSMAEAMRYASAASALACTKRGAQKAMPSRKEVETFLLQKNGVILRAKEGRQHG
jgi:ribokinase